MVGKQIAIATIVSILISVIGVYLASNINNDLVIVGKLENSGSLEFDVKNNGPAFATNVKVHKRKSTLTTEGKDPNCATDNFSREIKYIRIGEQKVVYYYPEKSFTVGTMDSFQYCVERDGIFPFEKFFTFGRALLGTYASTGAPVVSAHTTDVSRSFFNDDYCLKKLIPICIGTYLHDYPE